MSDDDLIACADLVRRADPDRFRAVMAAPPPARRALFPLYAMNVEVSRAPWVTQEPLIAQMRLQWWRDALAEIAAGSPVRRHEVVTPLAATLSPDLAAQLDDLVAARARDISADPFPDPDAIEAYIDRTAGTLLWAAARALGPAEEMVVRDAGVAAGVANWLRALPELAARGHPPLAETGTEAIQTLVTSALHRLHRARTARSAVSPAAAPAMLAVWQARAILRQALRDPDRVLAGSLGTSEARKRLTLLTRSGTGRW